MLKKIIVLSFMCSYNHFVYSQGINNLWTLGYGSFAGPPNGGINIDFQTGTPSINYLNRNMSFAETNGEICDSAGNLLFTSNGDYIANSLDDTMNNGSGLNPNWFTSQMTLLGLPIIQANLVLPKPGSNHEYYLFHCTIDTPDIGGNGVLFTRNLFYSTIDMNLDNGLGAVTDKNHLFLQDSIIMGIYTAVKHANGRDWWIVSHKKNSSVYFKYLLTPDSLYGPYLQDIGITRFGSVGQMAFSPNGEWFGFYDVAEDLDIMQFDRCSGNFYSPTHVVINDSAAGGGVAFSANSNVLYVSSMNYIYQYDLSVASITASQTTVAVWDSFYSPQPPFSTQYYLAQLAPDNKIYVICGNSTLNIHVINNPDTIGTGCDVCQHCIHLPAYNGFTIPNHPNYFLGPDTGSICDSLGLGINDNLHTKNINLRVNPNPAQNSFYLNYQLPSGINAEMHLYNMLGIEVMHKKLYWYFGYLQIDANALDNGVYFIKVETSRGFSSCKFIISK